MDCVVDYNQKEAYYQARNDGQDVDHCQDGDHSQYHARIDGNRCQESLAFTIAMFNSRLLHSVLRVSTSTSGLFICL